MRVKVEISGTDTMRWMTILSVAGLAAAATLAVIGGLPFDLPMPTHTFGWVEPTCGLTRGSTALARGDVALAWRYNPASFLVMLFGVLGVVRAGIGTFTQRWVRVSVRWPRRAWIAAVAVAVLLEANQQSHAQFIIHARL